MCGVYDVVDEVPDAGEQDQRVIYSQKPGSPDQRFGGLVPVVVEYSDQAGVVIIIPVHLLFVPRIAVVLR